MACSMPVSFSRSSASRSVATMKVVRGAASPCQYPMPWTWSVPCQRQCGSRHGLQALLQLFDPIQHRRICLVDLARPVLFQGVLGLRRRETPQGGPLLRGIRTSSRPSEPTSRPAPA